MSSKLPVPVAGAGGVVALKKGCVIRDLSHKSPMNTYILSLFLSDSRLTTGSFECPVFLFNVYYYETILSHTTQVSQPSFHNRQCAADLIILFTFDFSGKFNRPCRSNLLLGSRNHWPFFSELDEGSQVEFLHGSCPFLLCLDEGGSLLFKPGFLIICGPCMASHVQQISEEGMASRNLRGRYGK